MKKIIALLLACVMVLGLFAACTPAPADNTATNPTAGGNTPAGPTADAPLELTIRVWTPAEDQAEGNNWLDKMEKKFEAAHPEYKITWVNESCSEGDAANNITTDVTDAADVYMFANDQLGRLITAGGLSKLGGAFADQVNNDNTEFYINTVTHTDGAVYAFPVTNNVWFTYYDKTVYTEEDVKSLDTMLEKGIVCLPVNDAWNAGFVFLGCGGTVFGPAGNDAAAGINFGGENGYMAAEKMVSYSKLVQDGKAIAGGMDAGKLISGEADVIFSGSWSYAELSAALGENLGVAQLPYFNINGTDYPMTALGGTKCVGVNPSTSGAVAGKQRACTEFAAFLASEEGQLERYTMRNVIPSHKALAENEAVKSNPVAVAEIATMNNNAVVQSALTEMGNYWDPVATFSKSVYNGDINETNFKESVDQLMVQLNPNA